jgi:hypothetical protein
MTFTEIKCPKCSGGYLAYYEIGQPSYKSYQDGYACYLCGYNPDKDEKLKEADHEEGKGRE